MKFVVLAAIFGKLGVLIIYETWTLLFGNDGAHTNHIYPFPNENDFIFNEVQSL